ncbi:hypothetical protein [Paenibacillus lactis]|uniref:hypothetical protein n=1 Tax=Paenibacillus lactis TaxID=228574 RepID=UPI003D760646
MIHNIHPCSPVEQEFIWVAEHEDTTITEYDFLTKEENQIKQVDRNSLLRFGLIGRGNRYYYEVFGGTFKIAGRMYDFSLISNDIETPLTGRQQHYNDFITYKNAEMYINPHTLETVVDPTITDYVFGYKTNFDSEDLKIQFKVQCLISYDNPMYFNIRLVPSKKFKGNLLIKKNGETIETIPTDIKKNKASELNWIIQ